MKSKKAVFEANLEMWSHTHPQEAVWLPYLEIKPYALAKTKKGEPNLKTKDRNKFQFYHSTEDALKEARDWFQSLNLKNTDVLYVYGIGLGYYYEAAKGWLKKNPGKQIVFLEDDIGVVYRFFETETAFKMLKDSQAHLYFFKEITEAEAIFNRLFWNFNMAHVCFSALKLYENKKKEAYEALRYKITYDTALKNSLLEEYLTYGVLFFRNFYANLSALPTASLGNRLFGKFKDIPAIICGAGPSLARNAKLLKKLENKALIFAGSSSLNALAAAGVKPHFGVGIDPNSAQEERLSKLPSLDFPYFYRNRIYPQALDLVKGPKLYVTGSGGYDIASWLEKQLGIYGELLDEGRNVVNFSLQIAHALGCNPIIAIGVDLAYTGGRTYAPGVTEETLLKQEDLQNFTSDYDAPVMKMDINGQPVQTLWKWVAESNWIADFAKDHPEMTLVNATEGGLGFPGIRNLSLQSAIDIHLKKNYQLKSKIKKQIDDAKIKSLSKKKIAQIITRLKESLVRCLEGLNILIEENELTKKELQKKGSKTHLQSGRAVLAETSLDDEDAYLAILQLFNVVYSMYLERELIAGKGKSEKEKTLLRLDLNTKKYQFLKNACLVNLELIKLLD